MKLSDSNQVKDEETYNGSLFNINKSSDNEKKSLIDENNNFKNIGTLNSSSMSSIFSNSPITSIFNKTGIKNDLDKIKEMYLNKVKEMDINDIKEMNINDINRNDKKAKIVPGIINKINEKMTHAGFIHFTDPYFSYFSEKNVNELFKESKLEMDTANSNELNINILKNKKLKINKKKDLCQNFNLIKLKLMASFILDAELPNIPLQYETNMVLTKNEEILNSLFLRKKGLKIKGDESVIKETNSLTNTSYNGDVNDYSIGGSFATDNSLNGDEMARDYLINKTDPFEILSKKIKMVEPSDLRLPPFFDIIKNNEFYKLFKRAEYLNILIEKKKIIIEKLNIYRKKIKEKLKERVFIKAYFKLYDIIHRELANAYIKRKNKKRLKFEEFEEEIILEYLKREKEFLEEFGDCTGFKSTSYIYNDLLVSSSSSDEPHSTSNL